MSPKIDEKKIYENRDIYRHDIPLFSRRVVRLDPTPEQEKAMIDFQRTGRLAVKAGHGVGKTAVLVVLMFHELYCHTNSIVPCTAPTKHQLFDVLWTEAARWMRDNPLLEGFFSWTATRIAVRGYENIWYAVAVPSSNPNALAGFHARSLLYCIDEAPGIRESSWAVIEGAITREGNKIAMIGNPTRNNGYFHDAFGKNLAEWSTGTISAENNILTKVGYVERYARIYGAHSNVYRVRVLGQFPLGEDDSVLPIDLVDQAMKRDVPEIHGDEVIEGGTDVARYGADRTVSYVRRGFEVVDEMVINGADLMTVSASVVQLVRKWTPKRWKIDQTGLGSGVVDRVRQMCDEHRLETQIVGVDNAQRAVESDKYQNAATEMYFNLRDTLEQAKLPDDDELLGELTMRKYRINRQSGKIEINSKEDLRTDMKRDGLVVRSPDKADALALAFYTTQVGAADSVIAHGRASAMDRFSSGERRVRY